MNKTYKLLTLSMLLSTGFYGMAQAKEKGIPGGTEYNIGEPGESYGPGTVSTLENEYRDNDNETFWRIQNRSNQKLKIKSDIDFISLPVGADYRLDRANNFNINVNGQVFPAQQDHVLVFYNDGSALKVATGEQWDSKRGFGTVQHGVGIGTGLGAGFSAHGNLGFKHGCRGQECLRAAVVGYRGHHRGMRGGRDMHHGQGKHGKGQGHGHGGRAQRSGQH